MATSSYRLHIWGARGTVPTPTPDTLRYGGNTPSLSVDLGEGAHLIVDCGSGIRLLGNSLSKDPATPPGRFHVFFSHYHFDHVEGLPLFHPLYDARSTFTFYGFDAGDLPVREVLESLIRPPYFPVDLARAPSSRTYVGLREDPVTIGDLVVASLPVNHPDGCLAYRIEHGDRGIVYATDHEHGKSEIDDALVEFARGVDYLIYDATYMHSEYEKLRRGWGHSTWYAAVQAAIAAKVGTLVLFHHHPEHTDDELEKILGVARQEFPSTELAREGLELPF